MSKFYAISKPKVLIIDDTESNIIALTEILEELPIQIQTADSGFSALDLLLNEKDFVCILLDVNMPGMDGFETAKYIKSDKALKHIPILFVTANPGASHLFIAKGYDVGAIDFLIKPLHTQIVTSKISIFLELYQHRKQLERTNKQLKEQVRTQSSVATPSQTNLLQQAHQEGMELIANNTLHNVGNLLNNITCINDNIKKLNQHSVLQKYFKANQLIKDHQDNLDDFILSSNKIKPLLQYFLTLEPELKKEARLLNEMNEELKDTIKAINHTIINQLNISSSRNKFVEEVNLKQALLKVLGMMNSAFKRHQITVELNLSECPLIKGHYTIILFILSTILSNAQDAILDSNYSSKKININMSYLNNSEQVKLDIRDTGVGLTADAIHQVFNQGYTSKINGNSSDLHFCSNYLNEIGGGIKAASHGKGKGACFSLLFPIIISKLLPESDLLTNGSLSSN